MKFLIVAHHNDLLRQLYVQGLIPEEGRNTTTTIIGNTGDLPRGDSVGTDLNCDSFHTVEFLNTE